MADAPDDDAELREMARHRGFKLVKSRVRTPGRADYGRYGLTDAAGKKLFGFGDKGLVATAEEIRRHLRSGAAESWKQSAKITKAAPRLPTPKRDPRRERRAPAAPSPPTARQRPSRDRAAKVKPSSAHARAIEPTVSPPPPPPPSPPPPLPEPKLKIRPATRRDAEGLAKLIAKSTTVATTEAEIARRLSATKRAGGGVLVAMREEAVGMIAWSVIPMLHEDRPLARLTMILVSDRQRRAGIGSALVNEASLLLARQGCPTIEAMSAIDMRNIHGFFRKLGFERTSYRYALTTG